MKKILLIISMVLLLAIPIVLADAHLPLPLLNAQKTANAYEFATSILGLVWQSVRTIASPMYLILALLYIPASLLFFTPNQDIVFFLSFIFMNYMGYFFQTGIISLFYVKYGTYVVWAAYILLALSALIILIKAIQIKNSKLTSILPVTLGLSLGLFYFPVPRMIERAFELIITNYAYFSKFVFSLKIILFLAIHVLPLWYVANSLKTKKQKWAVTASEFIVKKRTVISYLLSAGLVASTILAYLYKYQMF